MRAGRLKPYNRFVRLAPILCLLFVACYAADAPDPKNDNLQAIRRVMRERDASLNWFQLRGKKPVDSTYSVMLVEAAPTELRPRAGKFIMVEHAVR